MESEIRQIIDDNTEGNYLLSEADKEKMVSEISELFPNLNRVTKEGCKKDNS